LHTLFDAPLSPWPNKKVWGFDTYNEDSVPLFPVVEGFEAFATHYDTEAHCPGYTIPQAVSQPRATTASLGALCAMGLNPVMTWVFVDVDNAGHAPWTKGEAEARVRALFDNAMPGSPLANAGVYTTPHGFRLVWQLAKPIPVQKYRSWATQWHQALSRATGLPITRHGATEQGGIDYTCNQWTRGYKLPYIKIDGVSTDPYVDLSRCYEPLNWTAPKALVADPMPAAPMHGEVIENMPPFPAVTDVTPEQWGLLSATRHYRALYDGTPLAERGGRDNAMIAAIRDTIQALDTADTRLIWNVCARAIASDHTDGAPTLDKLWNRIEHFASMKATEQEVAAQVAENPLIIGCRAGFYVRNEQTGGYMPPVPSNWLAQQIAMYSPNGGFIILNERGVPRDSASLAHDYGQYARRIVVRLGATLTTFDRETGTLTEAPTAIPVIEPQFSPVVDKWLRLLGGDGPGGSGPMLCEKWMDWLATIMDTERPTCAVYIESVKGTGKGMLSKALAGLWGAAAATSYADATGPFNYALVNCPLVHIDEGVDTGAFRSSGWSSAFRSLISESSRPLTRKYADTATLEGCPRVLITANNGDALHLRERLTANDQDAIAARILHIYGCSGAAAYLEALGGRDATQGWVDAPNGELLRHLVWLRENRKVKYGNRFIVEGVETAYHQALVSGNPATGDILEALAYCFAKPQLADGIVPGPNGLVYINVQGLKAAWAVAVGTMPPGARDIANGLKALSVAKDSYIVKNKTRRIRAWPIRKGDILRVAENLQIGDADSMTQHMMGPEVVESKG
jgi:hypothetical protein